VPEGSIFGIWLYPGDGPALHPPAPRPGRSIPGIGLYPEDSQAHVGQPSAPGPAACSGRP
jgi:hypothetical protein